MTVPARKTNPNPNPGVLWVVGVCPSRLLSHCQFTHAVAMEHLDTNSASQCGRVQGWPKRMKEVEGCRSQISLQPRARMNSTEQVLDLGRHILMEPRRTNQSEEVANSHRSREAGTEHHGWGTFHWKKTKAYFATKSFKRGWRLSSEGKRTLISAALERGLRGRAARPLWTLSAGS